MRNTTKHTTRIIILALFGATFAFSNLATADLANFDFEAVPVDGTDDGTNATLVLSDTGLTITISRTSGINFDVINDDAAGFPNGFPSPGWGNQALSPFFAPGVPDFFLVNFSTSVDLFGIQMGDFGGDTDDLFLNAWSGLNGTGTLLDSAFGVFTDDFNLIGPGDGPANLVVTGVGIQSVTFRGDGGGGSVQHSVYYDNFRISFVGVPEPSSLSLIGLASLGLAFYRRKQA